MGRAFHLKNIISILPEVSSAAHVQIMKHLCFSASYFVRAHSSWYRQPVSVQKSKPRSNWMSVSTL